MKFKGKGAASAFAKNYLTLKQLLIFQTETFAIPIVEAIRKFNKIKEPVFNDFLTAYVQTKTRKAGTLMLEKWMQDAYEKRLAFVKLLDEESSFEFYIAIHEIAEKNNLGKQWLPTIMDMIISGFIFPPTFNLDIKTDRNLKRIGITLGPNAEWADVEDAKEYIIEEIKTTLTQKKRINPIKKNNDNLDLLWRFDKAKRDPEIFKDMSSYSKYKPKDIDIVGYLFRDDKTLARESAALRKVNQIRQIKSRLKTRW